jgi:hypothetical protein
MMGSRVINNSTNTNSGMNTATSKILRGVFLICLFDLHLDKAMLGQIAQQL